MAKLFRLACPIICYPCEQRPEKPRWLREENRENATRSQAHSYNYWTKIYWATPPWLAPDHIDEMREVYLGAASSEHVDHIVPLSSPVVCGLHVPWNLRRLDALQNLIKSNDMWPGHPCEHDDLFADHENEPHQLKLL